MVFDGFLAFGFHLMGRLFRAQFRQATTGPWDQSRASETTPAAKGQVHPFVWRQAYPRLEL